MVMKKLFVIVAIISIALYCMDPSIPEIPEIKVVQEIKGSLIAPLRKLSLKAMSKLPADQIISKLTKLPTDLYFPLAFYIFIDPKIQFDNKKKAITAIASLLEIKKIKEPRITLLNNLLTKNAFSLAQKDAFRKGIDSLVQNPLSGKGAKNLLHLAITKQAAPLVEFLLEEGANANLGIDYSQRLNNLPIALAIQTQNLPIIQLIAKFIQLPKIYPENIIFHPLIIAARTGNEKIVKILLEKGFDLNTIYQIVGPQTILDIVKRKASTQTMPRVKNIEEFLQNQKEFEQAKTILEKLGAKTADELE